ncbi:DNA-dependent ATPase fun30 [Lithohypha guttulata]|uniref:DNA-dependent ATPase fun30 n=1 Tax=Lithohypha guttulata TaxID=1690604 RepID=A0AAN7Y887_9EURO|nr:DNA-dependent ATPase fun30 [Lithohypha guttulata]
MSSSPVPSTHSADDLFNIPARPPGYTTQETIPVPRTTHSSTPFQETLLSLPQNPQSQPQSQYLHTQYSDVPGRPQSASQYVTQPTQIIPRSPGNAPNTDFSSPPPPSRSVVQVVASSPIAPPRVTNGRTGGILGTAMHNAPPGAGQMGVMRMSMAPAGTSYRQPIPPRLPPGRVQSPSQAQRKPAWFPSDPESSDNERLEAQRNNIKTRVFKPSSRNGTSTAVLSQPPTSNTFSGLMNDFGYQSHTSAPPQAVKRSADVMANSYGNVQKRRHIMPANVPSVQQGPSSATQPYQEIELDDIRDPHLRRQVERLQTTCSSSSVRQILHALQVTKNFDDAADMLLLQSESRDKHPSTMQQQTSRNVVVLPSSDDELLYTPARPPKGVAMTANQYQAAPQQIRRAPTKSIAQKWGSTQQPPQATNQVRRLDVFDTPPPQEAKKRTLMRGRKNRSPSGSPRKAIVLDDSDEVDSGIQSEAEDAKLDNRVLIFFNTCTAHDLMDMSGIPKDQAEHFVGCRPFASLQKVFDVQNPNNKNKTKKGSTSYGERIWDKVYEMTKSYEAVDFVVKKCEQMSKPLAQSMSAWCVDVYGKGKDTAGIDLVDINALKSNAQVLTGKDSGIGTPISDDGRSINGARKGFVPQPPSLAEGVQMKDYQVVGLNWLYLLFRSKLSGILADDMGLGKTLQTIAFIAHLSEIGESGPHLIVVPAATLENWLKEFQRFAPSLSVQPYYGSIPEREAMRLEYEDKRDEISVIITTYQIAKAKEDIPWLRRYGFTCAIFDEGHMLKNPTSEVASKLARIKCQFRLLLTGTPLQNNLGELMGLLKFLMPQIFSEREEDMLAIFKQSISVTTTGATADSRQMLLSKQRIDRARSMLTPFILRRKKWQVLKDLPKKTRHVVTCELTQEQRDLYNAQLAKAWDIRERKARGERIPPDENANVLVRLRQAAIHPLLFRYFYSDKTLRKIAKTCPKIEQFRESNPELIMTELVNYADFETHDLCSKHTPLHPYLLTAEKWEKSGKITKMLELLTKFREDGHRPLIFSQFVMVLEILENVLKNHNISYLRLDGSTKVDERQDLIDLFNAEDSEFEVFMLSTKAGGAGINLTGASRVIVFDSGFNPQDDVQAENRCHRIGQTKDVEVYRLISEGSVEEQIYEMGKVKLQLDREVAGEDGEPQAVDIPASGVATPANEGLVEAEGVAMIEDLLFKKLEEEGKTPGKLAAEQNGTTQKKLPNSIDAGTLVKTENDQESSALSSLGSPLTELASSDSEDDKPLVRKKVDKDSEIEIVEEKPAGRGRRAAAQKASKNLKDPFADEPSSQRSGRGTKVKKESSGQATLTRTGRIVRGRK